MILSTTCDKYIRVTSFNCQKKLFPIPRAEGPSANIKWITTRVARAYEAELELGSGSKVISSNFVRNFNDLHLYTRWVRVGSGSEK